jgi:uncharacterized protein
MRWWDTSALLARLSTEDASVSVRKALDTDPRLALWWGTKVEAVSAIARMERTKEIRPHEVTELLANLDELLSQALQIPPVEGVRETACQVLRTYPLRAADALQLAAALVWMEHRPDGAGFVCLDRRLREAARREGFAVLPEDE